MQKKYIYYVIAIVILVIGGVFLSDSQKNTAETILIKYGDFINQVSVSGKVVASEEVQLAFQKEGRIDQIYYKVGQSLKRGVSIAKINALDAEKVVHDAEISLESAKLSLTKLKIEKSKENMNADLAKAYDDGFTTVSDAFLDLSTTIIGLEDLLGENNLSDSSARNSGNTAVSYRNEAEKLYYQALKDFENTRRDFRLLDRTSPALDIEEIIDKTYKTTKIFSDAIKSIRNLVDYLADDQNDSSSFNPLQTTLSEYSNLINKHLASLISIQNDIKDFKDTFSSVDLDTQDLELIIKQKENSLQDAKNKLAEYYIRAPFDGVVTKIDAKIGEIASTNVPLITIMSTDTFQIESYVPEINIALIKLGDNAKVTLDAYGDNIFFEAKVVSIDPAETIRDGVSTYKIKLQFSQQDERIKSGMTANVSIILFSKSNVVVVPGGVIFEKDGKKFVKIKNNKETSEREIITGDVSALGQVEIISGLENGDQVILNPKSE